MTDAMNYTAYGKAALKKFGDVPDGFKIYFAAWLGNTPEEWKSMQVRGAVFSRGNRIPYTIQTTVVTVEEIQKEKEMPQPEEYVQLPFWAEAPSNGDYMVAGAQLCTKDGRKCGNAVVYEVQALDPGLRATVLTDAGNVLRLYIQEMEEMFYPPMYVMKEALVHSKWVSAGLPLREDEDV